MKIETCYRQLVIRGEPVHVIASLSDEADPALCYVAIRGHAAIARLNLRLSGTGRDLDPTCVERLSDDPEALSVLADAAEYVVSMAREIPSWLSISGVDRCLLRTIWLAEPVLRDDSGSCAG